MDKYPYIEAFGHTITIAFGSSTGYPGFRGMQTSDYATWVKFDQGQWFKPKGRFNNHQIRELVRACSREYQLRLVIAMLEGTILEE